MAKEYQEISELLIAGDIENVYDFRNLPAFVCS